MIGAIVGTVASLGSAVYGAVASAKNNKKARQLISQQRQENKDWYNAKMNEDYVSRTDSQAILNKQREYLAERAKASQGAAAVSGASDESVALQKQADNASLAETASNIAANGQQAKDQAEQIYRQNDAALNQQQAQAYANQAQAAAQAAGQAVGAGLQLVGADIKGQADKDAKAAIDKITTP